MTGPGSVAITKSPGGSGIRDVTTFTFSTTHNDELSDSTVTWDFGDGASATGRTVTHVYTSEGTWTVTVRPGGKFVPNTRTVLVGDITGNWFRPGTQGVDWTLTLVQQGPNITGTWRFDYAPGAPPGGSRPDAFQELYQITVSLGDPRRITIQQIGQCDRTYTADVSTDLRTITGTIVTATCSGSGSATTFQRQ